jgi:uncharacterized DUF497 family protein
MIFEWDDNKNTLNFEKHGVCFEDAKELFTQTLWEFVDTRYDYGEKRMVGFGYVKDRLMNIVYTEPKPSIVRIISFRRANSREEALYEKNFKK